MRIGAVLTLVCLVWGSTFLAIEVAVAGAPPMLLMAARFLVAGSVLFVVASLRSDRHAEPLTLRHLVRATVTGGLLLVGGTGLLTLAQVELASGTVALLAATVPLFLALLAWFVLGERLSPRAWAGLAVGLVAVGVLGGPSGGRPAGVLLALSGAAAWAAGSLRGRRSTVPLRPLAAAALEMLGAAALFGVVGLLRGEHREVVLSGLDAGVWAAFAYLVVGGSLVAYTAYAWLLRHASTSVVGAYAYVAPLVAVGLGWSVLGEPLGSTTLVAAAAIVASVALLLSGRPGRPLPAQATSGGDVFAARSPLARVRHRVPSPLRPRPGRPVPGPRRRPTPRARPAPRRRRR